MAQSLAPSVPAPDFSRDRVAPPNLDLLPLLDETSPSLEVSPPPPVAPQPTSEAQVQVKRIEVQGSTIFSRDRFAPILTPLEGRAVRLPELQTAADAITQLYIERGYITSRAILADQTIQNGLVVIQVIEGQLTQIEIQGNHRVNRRYIMSRIRMGAKPPLKTQQLEDQLRLLKANPLFKTVEGRLKPGEKLGETTLIVQVTEVPAFYFTTFADNYSPPDVGSERIGGGIGFRNLTGFGDAIGLVMTRSTNGGASSYDVNYQLPVNARNGTVQVRATRDYTKITSDSFTSFGIRGNNERYEIGFRQPILRSSRQEFALSTSFVYQKSQTFLFQSIGFPFGIGPDADGVSTTSIVRFGQDYLRRDRQGAWALKSQFNVGTGLFNATKNSDPLPDGRFLSWFGQIQRVQVFGTDRLVIVATDIQLTPNSLLPQQQFVIGGGQSVRGFRQNMRSGDNGARFSVEARLPIQRNEGGKPIAQLAPFVDAGLIWNQSSNPNLVPSQTFLAGMGLGIIWEPIPRWILRLDYGLPLVNLSDRGDNLQDAGIYFSVNYRSR